MKSLELSEVQLQRHQITGDVTKSRELNRDLFPVLIGPILVELRPQFSGVVRGHAKLISNFLKCIVGTLSSEIFSL
jgi:hypothetical protein